MNWTKEEILTEYKQCDEEFGQLAQNMHNLPNVAVLKKACKHVHGKSTWKNQLQHIGPIGDEKRQILSTINEAFENSAMNVTKAVIVYRMCSVVHGQIDMNQFKLPCSSTASHSYAKASEKKYKDTQSQLFEFRIREGVSLLPLLSLLKYGTAEEMEILLPAFVENENYEFEVNQERRIITVRKI